jgi:centromere-localized protein 2
MAPTEATILSTFLLPPAPLPSLISLQAFTALFPRAHQSSPQIRTLYRDLQHQRAKLVDTIALNIATEVKRGNAQRRTVVRVRRSAGREEQDDEADMETAVCMVPF